MSRTYRRTSKRSDQTYKKYEVSDIKKINGSYVWVDYIFGSPEYKRGSARYHSDGGTYYCNEPGPKWFRNLTAERPHKRDAKNQLRRFVLDPSFEVVIFSKPKLEYWT